MLLTTGPPARQPLSPRHGSTPVRASACGLSPGVCLISPVLPCPVLSCSALSCPVGDCIQIAAVDFLPASLLSCPVLSCPVLSVTVSRLLLSTDPAAPVKVGRSSGGAAAASAGCCCRILASRAAIVRTGCRSAIAVTGYRDSGDILLLSPTLPSPPLLSPLLHSPPGATPTNATMYVLSPLAPGMPRHLRTATPHCAPTY